MFTFIFVKLINVFALICIMASFIITVPCTFDLVSSAHIRMRRILPVFYLGSVTCINLLVIADRLTGSCFIDRLSCNLYNSIVSLSGSSSADKIWCFICCIFSAISVLLIFHGVGMLCRSFMSDLPYCTEYTRDAGLYIDFGGLLLWSVVHAYDICV